MRYDSAGWWSEQHHDNTFPCTTSFHNPSKVCFRKGNTPLSFSKTRTITTTFELMGAATVLQLARKILWYQKEKKNSINRSPIELLYAWDGVINKSKTSFTEFNT